MNAQEMLNRISQLEDKISKMDQRLLKTEQRFSCQPIPDDCTEYKGALFQKKLGGGYREAIFCLVCGSPMTPVASATHFQCLKCGHAASFPGKRLSDLVEKLP